jgi:hypothetical protein
MECLMDRLKDKAHLITLNVGLLNFTVLPFCRLRVDNLFTLVTFAKAQRRIQKSTN